MRAPTRARRGPPAPTCPRRISCRPSTWVASRGVSSLSRPPMCRGATLLGRTCDVDAGLARVDRAADDGRPGHAGAEGSARMYIGMGSLRQSRGRPQRGHRGGRHERSTCEEAEVLSAHPAVAEDREDAADSAIGRCSLPEAAPRQVCLSTARRRPVRDCAATRRSTQRAPGPRHRLRSDPRWPQGTPLGQRGRRDHRARRV